MKLKNLFFKFKKNNIYIKIFIFILISILIFYINQTNTFLTTVAKTGGTLIEGVKGFPSEVSPLKTKREQNLDLNYLIYSSLFKNIISENKIQKDLIENYSISPNKLEYNFSIKKNIIFHNQEKLLVNDIISTYNNLENKKYPWKNNVLSIEKINDLSFKIKLQDEGFLLPFLDFPILKNGLEIKDLKKSNGTGPYQIKEVQKNDNIIREIELKKFKKYKKEGFLIENIIFKYYENNSKLKEALENKEINSTIYLEDKDFTRLSKIKKNVFCSNQFLPIFLNQNKDILSSSIISEILSETINRKKIIEENLENQALIVDKFSNRNESCLELIAKNDNYKFNENEIITKSRERLIANNWEFVNKEFFKNKNQALSIKVTSNENNFESGLINSLIETWLKIGILVEEEIYKSRDLVNNIIIPKDYDILILNTIKTSPEEQFDYWHSDNINYPKLNFSQYRDIEVDNFLEKKDEIFYNDNKDLISKFEEKIDTYNPVIFLYSPTFTYFYNENIKGIQSKKIRNISERFFYLQDWYIDSKKILELSKNKI